MKSQSENIKDNPDYLSPQEIEKYLNGEMSEREMYETELKLENNSLNAVAMEGFGKDTDALNDLNQIRNEFKSSLNKKNSGIKKLGIYTSAAAILVLLLSTYIYVNYYNSNNSTQVSDVVKEEKQSGKSIPVAEDKNDSFSSPSLSVPLQASNGVAAVPELNIPDDIIIENDITLEEEVVDISNLVLEDETEPAMEIVANNIENVEYSVGRVSEQANETALDDVDIVAYKQASTTRSATAQAVSPSEIKSVPIMESRPVVSIKHFKKLKLIDYSNVFASEIKISKTVNEGSLDSESTDKCVSNKQRKIEHIIEYISYSDFLEESMTLFDEGNFTEAIKNFTIINREHPEELNAKYYSGLANYEIANYEQAFINFNFVIDYPVNVFNEDANWNKALCLIKLNRIEEAKLLLQEIKDTHGTYWRKAKKQLKKLSD